MDILLSESLVARHPNSPTQLAHIITTQESDDLLQVVTTPTLFDRQKSVSWRLSGPAQEGSTHVDISRILFWIDVGDLDGPAGHTLEADLLLAQSKECKVTVMFVGFQDSSQEAALSKLIPRLEMRHRAQCLECQGIGQGLEQVYFLSLAMNAYHVVLPHSPLFTNANKLTYTRMLLQLDGLSVPHVKSVTRRFPSWRQLIDHLDRQVDTLSEEGEGLEPWVWEQLRADC
ncbi:hypothetical protein V5O48_014654 [Marasmius crinis-equi]|uniref:Uncharacterized protein n=1 Tax=Marasmius crinis-equi TaxID=585013 RepID=A0ABR3EWP9_9AGAR